METKPENNNIRESRTQQSIERSSMEDNEKALMRLLCCTDRNTQPPTIFRYRPIAPKPANLNAPVINTASIFTRKRTKRKYVKVSKINSTKRISSDQVEAVQTLQLLPKDDRIVKSQPSSSDRLDLVVGSKTELNRSSTSDIEGDRTTVETWVTVENVNVTTAGFGFCVTAALRSADVASLYRDVCPVFVSDGGACKVVWINDAYRRMVRRSPETTIVVWLVMDDTSPFRWGAFSCRVRVQYTWQGERLFKTVPCDVWRMEFGGFAWRLDTETALTLGFS